jgi:hypothetical protein
MIGVALANKPGHWEPSASASVMDGMDERRPKVSRRKFLKWGVAGLVGGTALGVVQSGMERTERTLRLPRWRADGFQVAHVSDVHLLNSTQLAAAH